MQTKLLIVTFILLLSHSVGLAITGEIHVSKWEIIIRTQEGTIRTFVSVKKKKTSLNLTKFYYGYYMNELYCKQGELQGKPLNGRYCRYDLQDNILESGNFNYGLKEGLWKNLSPGGIITETNEYEKGVFSGERVIYKNGKPDILEKYRKNKLIGKPKSLNRVIAAKNKENKFGKIKKKILRLIKKKHVDEHAKTETKISPTSTQITK